MSFGLSQLGKFVKTADRGERQAVDKPTPDASGAAPASSTATVASATATAAKIEAPANRKTATAAPATKPCPNCGATEPWGLSPWCPKCFFYPKLGRVFVETPNEEQEPPPPPPVENYRDVIKSLPPWLITLGAGVLAIAVFNVMLAIALPSEGWARPIFAILEVMVGMGAVVVAHAIVFMEVVPKTDRFSAPDFFLKPIEIWALTFHNLPQNAWRVWQLAWGLTGTLCALTFVGGIHYSAAFDDWGFQKRAAINVVQTIKTRISEKREEDTSIKPIELGPPKASKEALAALPQADCLIIGYTASSKDGFSSLLLATDVNGKLSYAGNLSSSELPAEARAALAPRLERLQQPEPLLKGFKTSMPAIWLRPLLMCRIAYRKTPVAGNFAEMKFCEMLADLAQ